MARSIHSLQNRISLSLFFSFVVLAIFVITAVIIAAMSFFLIRLRLVPKAGSSSGLFVLVLVMLLASVIVGTLVSWVVGRVPLQPIRQVIAATNQLARGDFSPRLHIARPMEFKALADSFNRMAEELGSVDLQRADFVNYVSHEFKTPIVSITGFAEMLLRDDLTPEERQDYLAIVIGEARRLSALATNILNLSKVENQTILTNQQSFDLGEQVRRSILALETRWEQKHIELALDVPDLAYVGNEELLNQVWVNLLDNAIKFTPDGGQIAVTVKREDSRTLVVIRDNGCGIDSEALPHIFDKFYQAHAALGAQGNGLGLALAKKIVALHGGKIGCISTLGVGTEFTVFLPPR